MKYKSGKTEEILIFLNLLKPSVLWVENIWKQTSKKSSFFQISTYNANEHERNQHSQSFGWSLRSLWAVWIHGSYFYSIGMFCPEFDQRHPIGNWPKKDISWKPLYSAWKKRMDKREGGGYLWRVTINFRPQAIRQISNTQAWVFLN